jgi:biopolymer transport protein ExbD
MLDVVFIMLIFFIVTTSFTRETGVVIDKPSAEQATALTNGTLLIAIRPNDEIWMARRQVELGELRQMILRANQGREQGRVVVVADRNRESEQFRRLWTRSS